MGIKVQLYKHKKFNFRSTDDKFIEDTEAYPNNGNNITRSALKLPQITANNLLV